MIPFFRIIRKKLADDNPPASRAGQFLKYSRYAIGEIVLVVVGILIALQINNWNEERKNKEMILILFKEVQSDLLRTLNEIQNANDFYNNQFIWIRKILLGQLSVNDYRENYELPYVIFFNPEYRIQKNGFEKLNNSYINIPQEYNDELSGLIDLYKDLDFTEKSQKIIEELTITNHDKIANSQHWYGKESWQSEEAINYFLSDPNYKNIVKKYSFAMEDCNLFGDMDAIVKTYILLSQTTNINELPTDFNHLIDQDLSEFTGIYQWKDSIDRVQLGNREISVGKDYLNYPGNIPFYEISKDSFVSNYNNTLLFNRDSTNQIIRVIRSMVGETYELEKID